MATKVLSTVALLALILVLGAPLEPLVVVSVHDGGLSRVEYFIPLQGNLSVIIRLVGMPDEALGLLVTDEWGEPLAYELNETLKTLFIACFNVSTVHVSYYTQDLTVKFGATWILNVSSPFKLRLALPENATITEINRLPSSIYEYRNRIVLEFTPGEVVVKYVVLYMPSTGTVQQPMEQETPTRPSQEEPQPRQPLFQSIFIYLFVALSLIPIIAILLALKRRSSAEVLQLSEEDLAILEALKRAGGGAFQSELQRAVSMPSTTLWRRVKRLEKLGYVSVEKRAGRNYVKLA